MSPAVLHREGVLPDDHAMDRQLTKHMGCITGFFHLFDRHHPISPRRKRLPPSTGTSSPSPSPSPSDRSEGSPRAASEPPRPSLPIFDFKEASGTSWKLRDSPRLSLDSRVPREIRTARSEPDSNDDRRSPSVVARLMGLDALPSPPELRRSSSAPRLPSPPAPPPPPAAPSPPLPPRGDFEMLKEILEAMQLKGLIHPAGDSCNLIRDRIVVARTPSPPVAVRRREIMISDPRPRRDRLNPPARPSRRTPSPPNPKRVVTDEAASRSLRVQRPRKLVDDDLSSAFNCERETMDYRNGRKLLERCDKLLHSIAEITEAGGRQTSPVSVLESAADFFAEESELAASPPSSRATPAFKRCLHFEDRAVEEEDPAGLASCATILEPTSEVEAADRDFLYVAKVLHATTKHVDMIANDNTFVLLEKEHKKMEPSKASCIHRKLVFDSVIEIVNRKKRLPTPWEELACSQHAVGSSPRQVWEELKSARESTLTKDDIYGTVCDALRKDVLGKGGEDKRTWLHQPVELSGVVLDIERLIFKDLIVQTIHDLAASHPRRQSSTLCPAPLPLRRKLVF